MTSIRLNASYAGSQVGTGTYTRNFMEALPELPHLDLGVHTQTSAQYWARRQREFALSVSTGLTVHPYWAASIGRRHIVSVLDFVQFNEATRFEQALLSAAARRAKCILVLSRHVGHIVRSRWDLDAVVAEPLPDVNWYESRLLGRVRNGSDHIYIGYWGGWHSRKNVNVAIGTLEQAVRGLGLRATFLVTGTPSVRTVLPETAVKSITGATVADVVALADSSDLCIYPSTEEGYGLPVKEALLRGRPILTSRLPVYDEFAQHPLRFSIDSWRSRDEVGAALVDALEARQSSTVILADRSSERSGQLKRLRSSLLEATL